MHPAMCFSMRCVCRIYLYVVGRKSEARKTEQARRVVKPFKVSLPAALFTWQQTDFWHTFQIAGFESSCTVKIHEAFCIVSGLPAVSGCIRMGP